MNQFFELLLYGVLLVVVDLLYLSQISAPFGKMVEKIQKKTNENENSTCRRCLLGTSWRMVFFYLQRDEKAFVW